MGNVSRLCGIFSQWLSSKLREHGMMKLFIINHLHSAVSKAFPVEEGWEKPLVKRESQTFPPQEGFFLLGDHELLMK
jgi:hypothetical protein